MVEQPVASPCNRKCCLDPADICIGCGRSMDEICRWTSYTNEEKQAIKLVAEQRLASKNQLTELL